MVPKRFFTATMDKALVRVITPPSKKHLGKQRRRMKTVFTTEGIWQAGLSAGLPAEDEQAGIARNEDGTLKPKKEGPTNARYRVKLQDPEHVKAFLRMETRAPKRGMGAARLILSAPKEKQGMLGKKVAMAAGPLIARANFPRGSAISKRLGTMSTTMNIVMMDENADVTFGTVDYPAPVRVTVKSKYTYRA